MSNKTQFSIFTFGRNMVSTVEPRFTCNKPLYNEVLSITNDFHGLSNSRLYGKEPFNTTKPCYSEHTLPIPWHFII